MNTYPSHFIHCQALTGSIYTSDGIGVVERYQTDHHGVENAEDLRAFADTVSLYADQSPENAQACVPANVGVILCFQRTVTTASGPVSRLKRKSGLDEVHTYCGPWYKRGVYRKGRG